MTRGRRRGRWREGERGKGVPKGEEGKKRTKAKFQEIMAKKPSDEKYQTTDNKTSTSNPK